MRGIFIERELSLFARHRPQVVKAITRRGRHGMVAVGEEHRVAVAHLMGHRFAVARIEHLMAESLR